MYTVIHELQLLQKRKQKSMSTSQWKVQILFAPEGEGGTLGILGWGYATGIMESLTHTTASSSEFCYPVLD